MAAAYDVQTEINTDAKRSIEVKATEEEEREPPPLFLHGLGTDLHALHRRGRIRQKMVYMKIRLGFVSGTTVKGSNERSKHPPHLHKRRASRSTGTTEGDFHNALSQGSIEIPK